MQGEAVRAVSPDQGAAFARDHGCLYKETSAKTDKGGVDEGVYDALVWGECRRGRSLQAAAAGAECPRPLCSTFWEGVLNRWRFPRSSAAHGRAAVTG